MAGYQSLPLSLFSHASSYKRFEKKPHSGFLGEASEPDELVTVLRQCVSQMIATKLQQSLKTQDYSSALWPKEYPAEESSDNRHYFFQ